jgi:hypothetical protein
MSCWFSSINILFPIRTTICCKHIFSSQGIGSIVRCSPCTRNICRLPLQHEDSDAALFRFDLETDVNPLFNWNVKLLFLHLSAEYQTKDNVVNQVVIWDTIIERTELEKSPKELEQYGRKMRRKIYHNNGRIDQKNLQNKYALVDDGHNLRGANLTFKLNWNVVPQAGLMFDQSQIIGGYVLPTKYVKPKRGENYKATDEI